MSSISASPLERRRFFLGVAVAATGMAMWAFFKDRPSGPWLLVFAGSLAAVELLLPRVAAGLFRAWMALARVLGAVNSRALIAVVYIVLFVPLGVWKRLREAGRTASVTSTWGELPHDPPSRDSYYRPY